MDPYFNESNIMCRLVDCSDFKNIYKDIKGISFFHLNISSLSKHIDSLSALIEQLIPFEIIAITETRISKEGIPHNIEIPPYTCILTKTEAAAGGTAIYIRNSLTFKIRNDLKFLKEKFLESTFVEIIQPKRENIIIAYISTQHCVKKNLSTITYHQNFSESAKKIRLQLFLVTSTLI